MKKILLSFLMLCTAMSAWSYETETVTISCNGTNTSPFTVDGTPSYDPEGGDYWLVRSGDNLVLKVKQSYYVTKVEFDVNGDNVENCDKLKYYTATSWVRDSDDTAYYDVITFSNEEGFSKVTSITVTYYHVCYAKAYHEATPGTCSKNGLNEYWECACGRMFSDADCTNEATKASLSSPIDPTNHDGNLQEVAFKNASVAENGVYHHWHCEASGNDYADADGTEDMNGQTVKARYKADALLVGNTTVDESHLLESEATVTFNGNNIHLDIDGDDHEYTLSKSEYLTIDFAHTFRLTANEDPDNLGNYYSTFFTSEGAYKVPETAKAYIGEVKKGEDIDVLNLTATADGLIPASEAVILRGEESDIVLMPSCRKDAASDDNMLQGSDEPMTLPQNSYALSYGQHQLGFYDFSGSVLPANKAYLTLDGSAAQSVGLRFSFGDTTEIGAPVAEPANAPAYNLQGQQVDETYRGIVIVNGKKVLKR